MRWPVGILVILAIGLAGCDRVFSAERPDAAPDAAFTCPAGFQELAGSFYLRGDELLTWADAEARCASLAEPGSSGFTHLAVMGGAEEFAMLEALFVPRPYWIGYTDIGHEGMFTPVTEEPSTWPPPDTPPWLAGQPNNLGGAQNCLSIDASSLLDDKGCTVEVYAYLCECDAFNPRF